MGELKIPELLIDALVSIAYDYMHENDFKYVRHTDWTDRRLARPAWAKINLCLQKIYGSPFPGPREAAANLEIVLAQYQLTFDGTRIVRISSRESKDL